MLRRLFFAAFAAGAIAGLGLTALQQVTTSPLIYKAETFEKAATPSGPGHADTGHIQRGESWAPTEGLERIGYTALANVIVAVGFALLLVGCFALHGRDVTGQSGVLWGLAGFAVFTLGPAVGLPPELPGMAAASLPGRQSWWLLSVGCTAGGLWLLFMKRRTTVKVAGAALLVVPAIVGAPHPDVAGGSTPAELASRFAAIAIVVSAVFWTLLGWLSGTFYRYFERFRPVRAGTPAP